jgi:GNAT superfamily N-acetyltransferase
MMLIRPALPSDVQTMHQFICDLAEFEREPDAVTSSPAQLAKALFDGSDTPGGRPALYAHVAEVDGVIAGMAIWFLNYSTWTGNHGIYLEDLYVVPEQRSRGVGSALMSELASIAVEHGYDRFQWWVLDWNQAAINVYERLGAEAMDEWTVHRLSGEPLRTLAARRSGR